MKKTLGGSTASSVYIKTQPEYQKHQHLAGVEIQLAEGARKYGVYPSTLWRWINNYHLIPVLRRDEKKIFLDESYVAYCSEVYRKNHWRGRGQRVFSHTGAPYKKKKTGTKKTG